MAASLPPLRRRFSFATCLAILAFLFVVATWFGRAAIPAHIHVPWQEGLAWHSGGSIDATLYPANQQHTSERSRAHDDGPLPPQVEDSWAGEELEPASMEMPGSTPDTVPFLGRLKDITSRYYDQDDCVSSPDSSDIIVVLKTGASEIATKLPTHLLTLKNCVHKGQLLVFSDLEDVFAGHRIHDALQNVSEFRRHDHEDFDLYRKLTSSRDEGRDMNSLRGGSWELDKWKFLPMTFASLDMALEHIKWFVFIEADTSVFWDNLLLWLRSLDPTILHYFGAPRVTDNHTFAHGGSGYVMSRPALVKLAGYRQQEGEMAYDRRWEKKTADAGLGDEVLTLAMREAGIELQDSGPMLDADKLSTMDNVADRMCSPIVSMHHVDGIDISDLWQFQAAWVRSHGWHRPILRKHLFETFIADLITDIRLAWDNNADDRRLIDRAYVLEEERHEPWFVKWKDMSPSERMAPDSASECASACDELRRCFQWKWRPGRCYLGERIRLGQPDAQDAQDEWTSGWHQERIQKLVEQSRACQ